MLQWHIKYSRIEIYFQSNNECVLEQSRSRVQYKFFSRAALIMQCSLFKKSEAVIYHFINCELCFA